MGEAYQPQKLYWSVFPRGIFKFLVKLMPLFRRDPRKFGRNGDIDLLEIVEHDYPPTTRVDVWLYNAIKTEASHCHTSQISGGPAIFARFPRFIRRRLNGYEHYRLVEPNVNGRRLAERDLFDGIHA